MKTGRKIEVKSENSMEGLVAPRLVGSHLRAPPVNIEHRRVNLQMWGVE